MECSETTYTPMLILLAIIVDIVPLCLKNWIEGYYGDVVVVTLCPWRLCHMTCLRCTRQKPTIGCFWVRDWSDTQFETYGVVAHLEYWSLGLLTVASITALLDWAESHLKRRLGCPLRLNKATLALLVTGCILSTLSVTLFAVKITNGTGKMAGFDDVLLTLAWPYAARVTSALLAWGATGSAICSYCRKTSTNKALSGPIGNVRVVVTESDYEDNNQGLLSNSDGTESGTLL